MSTPTRLAAFAAVVAISFAGAAALGAVVGPIDVGGHGGMHDGTITVTTTPGATMPTHGGGH